MALVFCVAGLAAGQETTGTITGRAVDGQGLAVPGAAVTATGAQGAHGATTDRDGRFVLPFLTPGTYTIRIELQGFKTVTQKRVVVSLGQASVCNLTMEVGLLTDTVEFTNALPVVDMRAATAAANLDSGMFSWLPVGRSLVETLYLAPGVSSGGGTGRSNPSMSGGSGLENQYVVDAVNISDTGLNSLGSYARGGNAIFGSLGTGLTYELVNEIQVQTAGYEADIGGSTGGVVNVITKSGTNELHGGLFGYTRPKELEAGYRQIDAKNGWVNTRGTTASDFGATVGGPVSRNHLFFFAAIDPQWDRKWMIAPDGTNGAGTFLFPLRANGEYERTRRFLSYSTKWTWRATADDTMTASFFGDPGYGPSGPQRNDALLGQDPSRFSSIDEYGGRSEVVKYNGVLSNSFLLEASWARAKQVMIELPTTNTWNTLDTRVTPEVRTGGMGSYSNNEGVSRQYHVTAVDIFGGHQLKYGAALEDSDYIDIVNYTGPTFTLPDGKVTTSGALVEILTDRMFGSIYRATRADSVRGRSTTQRYFNSFAQDSWRVSDRFTFRPGLRYEQQTIVGTLAHFTLKNNWAPRIGAIYDPTGSGKSKVYGNWARYYAKMPNDLAARALSADSGISRADYFDPNLTNPVGEGTVAAGVTRHFILTDASSLDFDSQARSAYLQEALAGFEYEAAPGMSVGIRFIHRTMPRILEDIGTAQMVAYDLNLPGLDRVEHFVTNVNRNTRVATFAGLPAVHFEDPLHQYDAVELTADKRLSDNWMLESSYRWSRLWGNFEGFYRNDNGDSDPALGSLFDFPTDDVSYTQLGVPRFGYRGDIRFLGKAGAGLLPNDRTHQFKLYGTYNLAVGLNVGVGAQLGSGMPLTPMAANPYYSRPGDIPMTKRGAGYQTVDGFRKRTPLEASVNAHIDWTTALSGRRFVLSTDVFNLGNLQRVVGYNGWYEYPDFATLNPDFGSVGDSVSHLGYQAPMQVRVGARFEF